MSKRLNLDHHSVLPVPRDIASYHGCNLAKIPIAMLSTAHCEDHCCTTAAGANFLAQSVNLFKPRPDSSANQGQQVKVTIPKQSSP